MKRHTNGTPPPPKKRAATEPRSPNVNTSSNDPGQPPSDTHGSGSGYTIPPGGHVFGNPGQADVNTGAPGGFLGASPQPASHGFVPAHATSAQAQPPPAFGSFPMSAIRRGAQNQESLRTPSPSHASAHGPVRGADSLPQAQPANSPGQSQPDPITTPRGTLSPFRLAAASSSRSALQIHLRDALKPSRRKPAETSSARARNAAAARPTTRGKRPRDNTQPIQYVPTPQGANVIARPEATMGSSPYFPAAPGNSRAPHSSTVPQLGAGGPQATGQNAARHQAQADKSGQAFHIPDVMFPEIWRGAVKLRPFAEWEKDVEFTNVDVELPEPKRPSSPGLPVRMIAQDMPLFGKELMKMPQAPFLVSTYSRKVPFETFLVKDRVYPRDIQSQIELIRIISLEHLPIILTATQRIDPDGSATHKLWTWIRNIKGDQLPAVTVKNLYAPPRHHCGIDGQRFERHPLFTRPFAAEAVSAHGLTTQRPACAYCGQRANYRHLWFCFQSACCIVACDQCKEYQEVRYLRARIVGVCRPPEGGEYRRPKIVYPTEIREQPGYLSQVRGDRTTLRGDLHVTSARAL